MIEKKDFKSITQKIKEEILNLGCGHIKFNKDAENLWIDDYENYLSASIHVDAIKIDYDVIILCEDGQDLITFDHIYSIDRQIQLYETIYEHQNQLHYYELDWKKYFKALRVKDETDDSVWRILSPDEARHLWFNGKAKLFHLYDDGTKRCIDDDERLEECINKGFDIGIPL